MKINVQGFFFAIIRHVSRTTSGSNGIRRSQFILVISHDTNNWMLQLLSLFW